MFCDDSDMAFSVYESLTALVGILAVGGVCCVRSRGVEVPDTISLDCFVRAAQTALLTRRGGGGESGERGAGGRMCPFGE